MEVFVNARSLLLMNLSVCALLFGGAASADPVFTEESREITLTPKEQTFTIKLHSNVTTGYSWEVLKSDAKMIKVVSHEYLRPETDLIGAPSYEVWNFKVLSGSAGKTTKLEMRYAQPWQPEVNSTTLTFDIKVEGAGKAQQASAKN
jgi:inhibitor of cysteine peptidase